MAGATGVIGTRRAVLPAGLRRVAAISASLLGTQALTSVLGLLFWGLAARRFSVAALGVGGAAVSLMMLLGTLATLGLGTLLIARLPQTAQGSRRVLVRTCLAVAGASALALALIVPVAAIGLFGAANLESLAGSPVRAGLFAIGTALMSMALVFDQAVLVLGTGSLQLERNVLASLTKLLALAGLSALPGGMLASLGGMTIFLAWGIGTLVSLPVAGWRTRGGLALQRDSRLVSPSALRGLGRPALGHHALNTTLMAPLLLLPLVVTLGVSSAANGVFTTALQVTGFVFALPYAVAVGLFAAAEGQPEQLLDRMRYTVPFGLAVSLLADAVLVPLAPAVLSAFGPAYAEQGSGILRVLVLAGLAFVIKDHFVALRRVQGRTGQATAVLLGCTAAELLGAGLGARLAGTIGLCIAWVAVLMLEALILAVPLWRAVRARTVTAAPTTLASPEPVIVGVDSLFDPVVKPREPLPGVFTAVDRPAASLPAPPPPPSPPPGSGRSQRSERTGPDARRRWTPGAGPGVLVMALGLLGVGHAVALALAGRQPGAAQAWYVAGLGLIFLPAAIGVMLPGTSRGTRITLAVAMPVFLQLTRVLLYPTRFMFHDELLHANLLREIGATGKLFGQNPLLPITSYYPGLEVATDGVRAVSGLSAHTSAVIVLVLARIVLVTAILAIVERITFSTRIGAVAGVIYACNPQLLFFNSQFSYQSLALPLALLTVYLFSSRQAGPMPEPGRGRDLARLALPVLALAAVSFSHHVTALLLLGGFAGWWLLEAVLRRGRPNEAAALGVMTAAGAGLFALGLLNPGNTLASYLSSIVTSSVGALDQLLAGRQNKQLFENSAGVATSTWEQVLVYAALVITVAVLVPALIRSRSWLRSRSSAAVLLCLIAVLYPLIPAGHVTTATAEVGDRSAGFVFVGVGFVVAFWLCRHRIRRWQAAAFGVAATITFLGGAVLGAGPFGEQLPGAFEVSKDARSIDPANLAAAEWIAAHLPAGSRVYADRESGLLAAADGGAYTVRHIGTNIDASRLLLDPQFGPADVALIRQARIRYLIADRRDAFGLPNEGVYIESGEFGELGRTAPVPAAALRKFDAVPGVDRIYDNGSIAIYDLGALDG